MKNYQRILVIIAFFLTGIVQAQIPGTDCGTFQPSPGVYYLSAWVKEVDGTNTQKQTYTNSAIEISFFGLPDVFTFQPVGRIIDGWQRVVGRFEIPPTAAAIYVKLEAPTTGVDVYFDDIRVVPFNGNMKSFVYDPETQRLVAELDENNYATFYEYDKEGGLIRVKKETENGVSTIQETRSGNSKLTTGD